MEMDELFDTICDRYKDYKNIEAIELNGKGFLRIRIRNDLNGYYVTPDLTLFIIDEPNLFKYNDEKNFNKKRFDDIDMLLYELDFLLCED